MDKMVRLCQMIISISEFVGEIKYKRRIWKQKASLANQDAKNGKNKKIIF